MSDSAWPDRWQPTSLPIPWDSPGKNAGVGCHFLLPVVYICQLFPQLAAPLQNSTNEPVSRAGIRDADVENRLVHTGREGRRIDFQAHNVCWVGGRALFPDSCARGPSFLHFQPSPHMSTRAITWGCEITGVSLPGFLTNTGQERLAFPGSVKLDVCAHLHQRLHSLRSSSSVHSQDAPSPQCSFAAHRTFCAIKQAY